MKKKNEFSTHKVIKDFGDARVGDTCYKSGYEKDETQFHSNYLFDLEPVYDATGKLVNHQSPSRSGGNYWVEWLKNSEINNYLKGEK